MKRTIQSSSGCGRAQSRNKRRTQKNNFCLIRVSVWNLNGNATQCNSYTNLHDLQLSVHTHSHTLSAYDFSTITKSVSFSHRECRYPRHGVGMVRIQVKSLSGRQNPIKSTDGSLKKVLIAFMLEKRMGRDWKALSSYSSEPKRIRMSIHCHVIDGDVAKYGECEINGVREWILEWTERVVGLGDKEVWEFMSIIAYKEHVIGDKWLLKTNLHTIRVKCGFYTN